MTDKTIVSMNVDITKLANEEAKRVIKELRQQLVDQEKLQDILAQHDEQANEIIDRYKLVSEELESLSSSLSIYKRKNFSKIRLEEVSDLFEDLCQLGEEADITLDAIQSLTSLVFKFRDCKPKKKITKSKKKTVKSK